MKYNLLALAREFAGVSRVCCPQPVPHIGGALRLWCYFCCISIFATIDLAGKYVWFGQTLTNATCLSGSYCLATNRAFHSRFVPQSYKVNGLLSRRSFLATGKTIDGEGGPKEGFFPCEDTRLGQKHMDVSARVQKIELLISGIQETRVLQRLLCSWPFSRVRGQKILNELHAIFWDFHA